MNLQDVLSPAGPQAEHIHALWLILLTACTVVFACVTGTCQFQSCNVGEPCSSASDCTGVLPALCMQCGGGGTACAHWACEWGVCVDRICPGRRSRPRHRFGRAPSSSSSSLAP